MKSYYIYYQKGRLPYTVLRDQKWPYGAIVQVASTLWGARRIIRRDAKRRPDGGRVLVEKVEL